ncbi:MAG TPA: glycosyltransferase family 2 protein [Burkholderiales bacterium]|nr:glycosyltransferase family 2 protein [Burkholderiales bacterium]
MKRGISLACPFYNEAGSVSLFFSRVIQVLEHLGLPFEIVCVNDGSKDATLAELLRAQAADHRIVIIDLSRNFGKEAALTAAIDHARGDAVIPIDADLQDPPELIPTLVSKWLEGFDVVVAHRASRSSDRLLKRLTATWFYRFHNAISEIDVPANVGDFRLMDRRVVETLKRLPERRRFMKGLFAWVGFRTAVVEYAREARATGNTKFSGWRLWNLALEGITSFSTVPLRLWTYIGSAVAVASFLYASFIVLRTLILGIDVPGYASLLSVILFLGGIQLIGIGVLGEYIGRIYSEAKQRPVYVVREIYGAAHGSRSVSGDGRDPARALVV